MKLGDVVVLRSGSPMMTVSSLEDEDKMLMNCIWFDEDDLPHESWFYQSSLMVIPPDVVKLVNLIW